MRGDAAAMHTPEEFVGTHIDEAVAFADALRWTLFHINSGGLIRGADTDRHDHVGVWTDPLGEVTRAVFR